MTKTRGAKSAHNLRRSGMRSYSALTSRNPRRQPCFSLKAQDQIIMQSKSLLAAVGVVALIIAAVYFINQSQKSDAEKLGDSLEEVGEDIADAVDDATE